MVSDDRAQVRPLWRQVSVPTEHGGWSLTAEPAVLGLLVAWSWAGLALGVAAMVAFLIRTPLKLLLVDRRRGRWLPRTRLAVRVLGVELVALTGLTVGAVVGAADARFWLPLAAAVPLVGVELWFDMRSRSRRLVPELAGAVGIGSVVAAIVLAGDEPLSVALGLWAVIAARAVAGIPYARVQVLRAHGQAVERRHNDLAQLAAVLVALGASSLDAMPVAPVVVLALVAGFHTIAVRRSVRPAVVIGLQQLGVGVAVIAVTAVAVAS